MADGVARPQQLGLSHLGLSVTDLERSITFYCDLLGAVLVRPPYEGESPSFFGRMALVRLGSAVFDLYEHHGNEGEHFQPARTGLDHLAFVAESTDDLEAWARWLDVHGIADSEIRDAGSVGEIFDFADPDGIQIEFIYVDRERLRRSVR